MIGTNRTSPDTETSASLISRVRGQDEHAWNDLVSLYAPLVYTWCRQLGLNSQEIPDIFQEVFQAVSQRLQQFTNEGPGATFRGWLRVITRNKVMDHYRRIKKQPLSFGGSEAQQRFEQLPFELLEANRGSSSQSSGTLAVGEDALLQRAMDRIREHFQESTWQAFWQTVVEGRSASEVAERLSMRSGTVRVAKSRVLQRLRQELGDVE